MANYLTGPHVYPMSQLFRDSFDVTEPTCLGRRNKSISQVFENKNALGIFETRPDGTENTTQLTDLVSSIYNLGSVQRQIKSGGAR